MELIEKTIAFVKSSLQNAESGHDWWHVERVWKNAKRIAEGEKADLQVVELAALLHDIADSKFHGGDENAGPESAGAFLREMEVDENLREHVVAIIRFMSFHKSFDEKAFDSPEMRIVQDADRLDAIGAIGIARAFSYGGHKNREMYNPSVPPDTALTKETYKASTAPTINHFYEKLLLLKDRMHTDTAKKIAEERHRFMEDFLLQFYAEWEGNK